MNYKEEVEKAVTWLDNCTQDVKYAVTQTILENRVEVRITANEMSLFVQTEAGTTDPYYCWARIFNDIMVQGIALTRIQQIELNHNPKKA